MVILDASKMCATRQKTLKYNSIFRRRLNNAHDASSYTYTFKLFSGALKADWTRPICSRLFSTHRKYVCLFWTRPNDKYLVVKMHNRRTNEKTALFVCLRSLLATLQISHLIR